MIGGWIEVGWVSKFTVVVLGVKGGLGSLSDDNELSNILLVGEVLVKVIFEMLEGIHMLLDEVVSSDLLEWEGSVIKLPSVNLWVWILTLLLELTVDGHGGVVMSLLEISGEVIDLDVHLIDGDLFTTWGWDESIWVGWVGAIVGWEWNGLRSGGDGDEAGEFHVN